MDVESAAPIAPKPRKPPPNLLRNRRCRTVCLSFLVLILLIVIILVILSLTLYKAKHPVTTVNSVSVRSLDLSILSLSFNVTLDLGLSIRNPNRVGFKYGNSTGLLNYRGELVGEVPIPADEISADATKDMNLTLTLLANRLLSNSQAYSDVVAGALPLNTFTRISGKVTIFSFVRVHVVSTTSCDFDLFVSNRTIGDQQCKYKTKL